MMAVPSAAVTVICVSGMISLTLAAMHSGVPEPLSQRTSPATGPSASQLGQPNSFTVMLTSSSAGTMQ